MYLAGENEDGEGSTNQCNHLSLPKVVMILTILS